MIGLGIEYSPCIKCDKTKCSFCEITRYKNSQVESISEKIIRKKAEVSDYWQNDVKRYRAMQGYSDIEHDTDNFLRGYNEAVEDILAILEEIEERS